MAKFLYSRVHHKPSDKHAVIAISVVVFILLFIGAYLYNYMSFSARDRVAKQYMKAINEKRPLLIEDVAAKEYDSQKVIENDIDELGGTFFIARSDYRASRTNGRIVDTTLYGIRNFKIIKKDLSLIGMGEAWYLVLGDLKEEFRN